jgi:uncharacterized protein
MDVSTLKEILNLEPLPGEGGWYCETYRSVDNLPGTAKPLATAIYYLLTNEADSFSALHRLPSDEIYHFYLGDPLEMLLLYPDGSSEHLILGHDLTAGQQVQFVVPAGVWQGSRVKAGGSFSLLGTTMAPGFTPNDYEAGDCETLAKNYPGEAFMIDQLTRN